MVKLDNYFDYSQKTFLVDDFVFKENTINARVDGEQVEVIFENNDKIRFKCSCDNGKCSHVKSALISFEEELFYLDAESLENVSKLESKPSDGELISILESINYNPDHFNNCEDKDKWFREDTEEANLNWTYFDYLDLIFKILEDLIEKESYDTSFKVIKKLYKDFFKTEHFIGRGMYYKPLSKVLKDLIKNADNELKDEIFKWLIESIETPIYNEFIKDIYDLSLTKFNKKENLEVKEEKSLIMFQKAVNRGEDFSKLENGYYELKRKVLEGLREDEYWFKYHLKVLKKLKYDKEEIISFCSYSSQYGLGFVELMEYYMEEENDEKILETIKNAINHSKTPLDVRLLAIDLMKDNDMGYFKSKEYLETLKKLIFKDKILNEVIICEYYKLNGLTKFEAEYILENNYPSDFTYKLLNVLYCASENWRDLFFSVKSKIDMGEFFKYEDIIIKNYNQDSVLSVLKRNIKRTKVKNDEDYNKHKQYLKHFKKYYDGDLALIELNNYYVDTYDGRSKIARLLHSKVIDDNMNIHWEELDK